METFNPYKATAEAAGGNGNLERFDPFQSGMQAIGPGNTVEHFDPFGPTEKLSNPPATAPDNRFLSALNSATQGAMDIPAGVAKGVGIAQFQANSGLNAAYDAIDRGADLSTFQNSFQYAKENDLPPHGANLLRMQTYSKMAPEQRQEYRAKSTDLKRPEDTVAYQAGESLSNWTRDTFPENPEAAKEFWSGQFPRGLGSTVGFLGTTAASLPMGGAPALATTAFVGSGVEKSAMFEDAINNGADLGQALEASDYGAWIGATEAAPIAPFLSRLDRITGGGAKRLVVDAVKQGSEEAVQEATQSILENLVANNLVAYDPERGTFTGAGESAGVGFTAGALYEGIGGLITGRHSRSATPSGKREQVATQAPELSDVDRASPIPDDFIRQGKSIMADGEATRSANDILRGAGLPKVNTPVAVRVGDKSGRGVVADAFETFAAPMGDIQAGHVAITPVSNQGGATAERGDGANQEFVASADIEMEKAPNLPQDAQEQFLAPPVAEASEMPPQSEDLPPSRTNLERTEHIGNDFAVSQPAELSELTAAVVKKHQGANQQTNVPAGYHTPQDLQRASVSTVLAGDRVVRTAGGFSGNGEAIFRNDWFPEIQSAVESSPKTRIDVTAQSEAELLAQIGDNVLAPVTAYDEALTDGTLKSNARVILRNGDRHTAMDGRYYDILVNQQGLELRQGEPTQPIGAYKDGELVAVVNPQEIQATDRAIAMDHGFLEDIVLTGQDAVRYRQQKRGGVNKPINRTAERIALETKLTPNDRSKIKAPEADLVGKLRAIQTGLRDGTVSEDQMVVWERPSGNTTFKINKNMEADEIDGLIKRIQKLPETAKFKTADPVEDFSPAVDRERLARKVAAIAQRIAPQTDVNVVEHLFGVIPGRGLVDVEGVYRPARNLIEVSLSRGSPEITVRHEGVHALKEMGLFSTTEWNILEERARRDWISRYNIERAYPGLAKEQKIEEAIAQAFAEYEAGGLKVPPGLRRILDKLKEFLDRLRNALRGMGFQTIDDVFERIDRGEVGSRHTKGGKDAAVPEAAPAYAAARHQLVEDETAWAETIQAYRDGALRSDKPVPVMETPLVMDIIGESSQPITMDYSTLKKVLDDKHGLPDHLVAQLPSRMADPIAVFDSKTADGALVFMLDLTDQDGATVMVALHLEVDKRRGFIVHDIASAYGRKQFRPSGVKPSDGWYVSQIEEGRTRYLHQRRSLEWAQSRGLQLPKEGTIRGSKGIIATERDLFNAKRESPDRYAAEPDGASGHLSTAKGDEWGQPASGSDVSMAENGPKTQDGDRYSAAETLAKHDVKMSRARGFQFTDRTIEARWQEASKGRSDPKAVAHQVRDWIAHIQHGFTRHHIHLPNEPEFAKAHEALRKVEAAPQAAKEDVVRALRDITAGMTAKDLDLFTRKVVLDDLAYEADQGHDLPFGLTAETLPNEKAKIDAAFMAWPNLREALKKRNRFVSAISRDLVDAGILKKEQLQNPAYFRHQVLDYARAQQSHLGSRKQLKTPRPGYAKGRKGSTLDINANYLEAEFEWLHRAMADIATAKAIETIKQDYDRHELARTAAESTNQDAIADMLKTGTAKTEADATAKLRSRRAWKTLEDFVPEGHVLWQPDRGNLFFVAKTLPERAVDHLMDAMAHENIPGISQRELQQAISQMREALVIGGPKYQMIIPEELAKTLDGLRNDAPTSLFDHLLTTPLNWWKRWVLINPRRVLKYNINNMSGDLDAVMAGNPRAIKKMPAAIKELWHVMHGAEPSARYREAVERGVFDSGLSVQEIPDIKVMGEFTDIIERPSLKAPHRLALSGLMKVWRTLQRYTGFRENWLRYAAYLDYVERLEAGVSMQRIGYGAAVPKMVDAITDPKDRAALLARELVGDYGNVSAFGQGLRSRLIPFYSWMEINTKRYVRLIGNAYGQGVGDVARVGAIAGAGITARLALRMVVMYALVALWNNLFFPDEEDELSDEERVRLHLNLGRDENGNIRTLRFQGALSDFLGWFGFEDAVAAIGEVQKGRADVEDILTAVAKAPINKVAGGITPLIKMPVELLSGQSFWPDVFNPRSIKDGKRHVARLFSVENEYDWLADRPTRGYMSSIEQAVVTKRDPEENAYNRSRGLAYDWLRKEKGTEGSSNIQSPRSKALYDWRLAKKFRDREAERNARRDMYRLGMSEKDIEVSVKRAHPLGMIPENARNKFIETLTATERRQLRRAIQWYAKTFLDGRGQR